MPAEINGTTCGGYQIKKRCAEIREKSLGISRLLLLHIGGRVA